LKILPSLLIIEEHIFEFLHTIGKIIPRTSLLLPQQSIYAIKFQIMRTAQIAKNTTTEVLHRACKNVLEEVSTGCVFDFEERLYQGEGRKENKRMRFVIEQVCYLTVFLHVQTTVRGYVPFFTFF
jgi:hypothetical protein